MRVRVQADMVKIMKKALSTGELAYAKNALSVARRHQPEQPACLPNTMSCLRFLYSYILIFYSYIAHRDLCVHMTALTFTIVVLVYTRKDTHC